MDNQELINEYLAGLSKSVTDLTLENLLLKSRILVFKKENKDLSDQFQKHILEIKELKNNINSNRDVNYTDGSSQ